MPEATKTEPQAWHSSWDGKGNCEADWMARGIVKQGGKKGVDATCKAVGAQPDRSDLRTRFVMAPKAEC